MNTITRNPLCWPDSVPRTAPHSRRHPLFKSASVNSESLALRHEINRLKLNEAYEQAMAQL